jgi:uncharacterized protein (TIGR00725 family)
VDAEGNRPTTARRPQATLIGDSDAAPEQRRLAAAVGGLVADLGMTLVTGGRGGVMEAACRAAVAAGGTTIGILPSAQMDEANRWCSIVIPTGLDHARNAITALAGDLMIVIGGGAGTLSEIAFAWLYGRPIMTLAGSGGWADEAVRHAPDARRTSTITACADLAALEAAIRQICNARGLPLAARSEPG